MNTTDKQLEFVQLRAENVSYERIAEKLNVSRSTLRRWADDLRDEIEERKEERLQEVYDLYRMAKIARLERLGKTLQKIDEQLEKADLSKIPPDKLLDFLLKYQEAIKAEYVKTPEDMTAVERITKALGM